MLGRTCCRPGPAGRAGRGPGRTGQVEQVRALGLVQLQRAGDSL